MLRMRVCCVHCCIIQVALSVIDASKMCCRRISEVHAKVDSYMYMKRQMSAPDIHQAAEGGHRPGSGRGRPGSGRGRPGSGHGRPGSGCGRPGSGRGLHTPGGGNIKIFSAQLPDFSRIKSHIDSSPPMPKEAVESQVSAICVYMDVWGASSTAVLCKYRL